VAVLVVRHAKAGDSGHWDGPDHVRPLTAKGRAQADGLVAVLHGFGIGRILSSPYLRCTQTVDPLAAAMGLPVEPTDDLAEGAGAAAVHLVRSLVGTDGAVVLCTHGDVIGDVLEALGRRDGPLQKGSTWVVEAAAGGSVELRYLPPPA